MSDVDIAPARTTRRSPSRSRTPLPEVVSKKPRTPLPEIIRKKPRKRFRGVPLPLTFDIDALPDSTLLTETEVAAILRRSKSALEGWRKDPDHPLKWQRVLGRITYGLGYVRAVQKGTK
jgi:hypothetical protein